MKEREKEEMIIQRIKDAVITKSIQDREGRPIPPKPLLGKNIIIPNDLRSVEDIKEDVEYLRLRDDEENVRVVFEEWLPVLDSLEQKIVILKCTPKVYWDSIIDKFGKMGINYSRRSLQRIFNRSIQKISKIFF